MPMRRYRLLLLATTVVAATAVITAASASGQSTSGTEHFSFVNTSTTSNTYSAIATGAFTAGGTANLPTGHGTLKFSAGTITVTDKGGKAKVKTSLKKCIQSTTQSGTYTITGGTGAYAGITGSGKFKAAFVQVGPTVKGKCSTKANAVAAQSAVVGSGPVILP
jgi:hypothetical protein